jgi:hypothetical protein
MSEKLALLVDRLDAAAAMLTNPHLPAEMHVAALRRVLPDLVAEMKDAVAQISDENPWET